MTPAFIVRQTSRLPTLVIQRLVCQSCERLGRECEAHEGVDEAFEIGRLWAEEEVLRSRALDVEPVGPWCGTREAAWRKLREAGGFERAALVDVVRESARARWAELCPPIQPTAKTA